MLGPLSSPIARCKVTKKKKREITSQSIPQKYTETINLQHGEERFHCMSRTPGLVS